MVATLLRENILPIGAPRLEIENISALLSHSLKPSLVGPKDASACAFLLCSSDDCHIVSALGIGRLLNAAYGVSV
jgi:hypothetical protein